MASTTIHDALEDIEADSADRSNHAQLVTSLLAYDELEELIASDFLATPLFTLAHHTEYARFLASLTAHLSEKLVLELVLSLKRVSIERICASPPSQIRLASVFWTVKQCRASLTTNLLAQPFNEAFVWVSPGP
jgi:hypothetical protein